MNLTHFSGIFVWECRGAWGAGGPRHSTRRPDPGSGQPCLRLVARVAPHPHGIVPAPANGEKSVDGGGWVGGVGGDVDKKGSWPQCGMLGRPTMAGGMRAPAGWLLPPPPSPALPCPAHMTMTVKQSATAKSGEPRPWLSAIAVVTLEHRLLWLLGMPPLSTKARRSHTPRFQRCVKILRNCCFLGAGREGGKGLEDLWPAGPASLQIFLVRRAPASGPVQRTTPRSRLQTRSCLSGRPTCFVRRRRAPWAQWPRPPAAAPRAAAR